MAHRTFLGEVTSWRAFATLPAVLSTCLDALTVRKGDQSSLLWAGVRQHVKRSSLSWLWTRHSHRPQPPIFSRRVTPSKDVDSLDLYTACVVGWGMRLTYGGYIINTKTMWYSIQGLIYRPQVRCQNLMWNSHFLGFFWRLPSLGPLVSSIVATHRTILRKIEIGC